MQIHSWETPKKGNPQTVREMLHKSPTYTPRGPASKLGKMISIKGDQELRYFALKLNFPFAPTDHDHDKEETSPRFSMSRSVLYTRIIALTEGHQSAEAKAEAAELSDWVTENIKLPRDVTKQLGDASRILRSK